MKHVRKFNVVTTTGVVVVWASSPEIARRQVERSMRRVVRRVIADTTFDPR